VRKKKKRLEKHLGLEIFKPGKITVYVYIIVISLIVGFAALSFISSFSKEDKYKQDAIDNCIALCKEKLLNGEIIVHGPCLSESIAPGWVCDSVTEPRNKLIDDLFENQCASYREGINKKFVEVSTHCEFIRTN
jgi:hypothetical protein